jgi:hypothetical protein
MNLYETLMRMNSADRAQFLARAPQYITDSNFLNLLNRIDVNRKDTIGPTCALLRAFDSVPGLRAQLVAWIRSH